MEGGWRLGGAREARYPFLESPRGMEIRYIFLLQVLHPPGQIGKEKQKMPFLPSRPPDFLEFSVSDVTST